MNVSLVIRNLKLSVSLSLFFMLFSQLAISQSEHQAQLDTLAGIVDKVKAANYILKIEEFLPLPVRDSLIKVAIQNAEASNIDSLMFQTYTIGFHIDGAKDEFKSGKVKIDKALKIAEKLGDDKLYYSTLNNIGIYYQYSGDFQSADSIFSACIDFWHTVPDTINLSKGYNNKAAIYMRFGKFHEADSLVQIAKIFGRAVGPRVLTSAMNTELVIAAYSGKMKKAYEVSNEILATIEPIADKYLPFYAKCLFNNSTIATSLELNEEAMINLLKSDSIYQVLNHDIGQIDVLESIGTLYDAMGDHDLAIEYTQKAIELARGQNEPVYMASALNRQAVYYINKADLKDVPHAKRLLDTAFQIFEERGVIAEMAHCYHAFGELYSLESKLDSALMNIDKCIAIYKDNSIDNLLVGPYFVKSKILASQEKYRQALTYLNKINPENYETESELVQYNYLKGKVLSKTGNAVAANALLLQAYDQGIELLEADQAAKIKEVGDKYQADKQIAVSEKLKAEQKLKEVVISKQKQTISYGGIGLVLFSLLAYWFYQLSKKRKQLNSELSTQKKQVLLLNQELNHRVKNNLAFMSTLLEMQGRRSQSSETKQALRESESRLKALSLVHANLFKNETDTDINLKEYLLEITSHLREVFEIENKDLVIQTHLIDKVVDAEDAMRIGLILNELVTNSVKHAFAQIDNPTIQVETIFRNDKLLLRYKDNGPGIEEKELMSDTRKQGLGVKLIKLMEQQLADVLEVELGEATI